MERGRKRGRSSRGGERGQGQALPLLRMINGLRVDEGMMADPVRRRAGIIRCKVGDLRV